MTPGQDRQTVDLTSVETQRLLGERLQARHVAEMRLLLQNPDVMKHLRGIRTTEAVQDRVDAGLAHWDHHGFGIWMFKERDSGEFVGRAALRFSKRLTTDEPELLYTLVPHHWGKGFASELTKALLRVAFSVIHTESVIAVTSVLNRASQRVLEKAGFAHVAEQEHIASDQLLYRIEQSGWRKLQEGAGAPSALAAGGSDI